MSESLESEHPALIAALRAAKVDGPSAQLAPSVMKRVAQLEADEGLGVEMTDSRPELDDAAVFTEEVMRKVAQSPRYVQGSHELDTPRGAKWLSYVGTAIAAGLAVALFYSPLERWMGGEDTDKDNQPNSSAILSDPEQKPKAPDEASSLNGQVRFSRHYDGRVLWVIDVGLVEGARVGDVFDWFEDKALAGQLRVVGVSAFYSICAVESQSDKALEARCRVSASQLTKEMKIARGVIGSGQVSPGAFYGLGFVVESENSKVRVNEVIREIWRPDWVRPRRSRASAIGLKTSDRLASLMDQPLSSELDIEGVLSRYSPESVSLVMEVEREGKILKLRE